MSRKKSYLTVTDQFCGAGGSSQGVRNYARRAGLSSGLEVRLAMNHWKLALETHNTNFPEAAHVATDISACDPRDYPSTDILITSPECTNHSVAKGRKQVKAQLDAFDKGEQDAAAERSRATMWDVVRFAEYHKYRIIITENVVDACAWVLIDAWKKAMEALGYNHEPVFFNSMFAWPTPQSRDRVYYVFWRKGQRKPDLEFRPQAPCPKCGPVNAIQRVKPGASIKRKYGTQYIYVCPSCAKEVMPFYFAAINAIDFSVPAERIGDRKKPLEPRTMQRIAYGLEKYGNRPLSVSMFYGERVACRVKDATEAPLFTQHSMAGSAVAAPFLVNMRGTSADRLPHSTEGMNEALGTITGGGPHHGVLQPILVETKFSHAGAKRAKSAADPLPGQTGQASLGVAMPYILDTSFTKANGEYMQGGDEPMGTQTTAQSKAVVIPPALLMSLNYPEQAAKPVDVPMDTQTGNRPMALVVDTNYYTDHVRPADGVLPAQTGANKLAFLTGMRGTDNGHVKAAASGLDEPVGTISAGGNHHALISGKAMGFLQSFYGNNPVYAGMDDAMNALTGADRHALLTGNAKPRIEDLYFRMLKPHEVQAGMAFDREYVVLGNSREKVKQLGNAVTPPVMEMIVERCIQSLM